MQQSLAEPFLLLYFHIPGIMSPLQCTALAVLLQSSFLSFPVNPAFYKVVLSNSTTLLYMFLKVQYLCTLYRHYPFCIVNTLQIQLYLRRCIFQSTLLSALLSCILTIHFLIPLVAMQCKWRHCSGGGGGEAAAW